MTPPFNVLAVVQEGRLGFEAALLAASFFRAMPDFAGRLYLAEPLPGGAWRGQDTRLKNPDLRAFLDGLGAVFLPFEAQAFGASYPHGNKIEAIAALPEAPFLFLDTDTLILDRIDRLPFDFARPSASMRREGTWPVIEPYGPGYAETWAALYRMFGLDYESSLDRTQPEEYWQRHLYFNAGWFFHQSPAAFGARFVDFARRVRDDRPAALVCQELYPWLDQIVLPLVITAFGGGRPGPELQPLDGEVACHYRALPLLYARESDRAVEVLEEIARDQPLRRILRDWEPARLMIYQNRGRKARALFDREAIPPREQMIRTVLKREGLWLR